jgi:putative ABC transport system substrate-binding protein
MRRRELIAGLAMAAWPISASGQEANRVRRIGVLVGLSEDDPGMKPRLIALRQGLDELGWVEGRNLRVERRYAPGGSGAEQLAQELVALQPDVILSHTVSVTAALRGKTRATPIVFVSVGDPLGAGFISSLARPGGNLTGFAGTHADLMGKRLELLRDTVPRLARVVVLSQETNPGNPEYVRQAQVAARALGVPLQFLTVRDAGDFERAFTEARGASALIQLDDVVFTSHRKHIVELAVKNQLPAIYGFREFVDVGGLMAYGPDWPDLYRRAAIYVDKILKGAKAGDLPIEQPTKFELLINLKTAKTLRLTIPPSLLARADQVIE